jgi:putative pyruvate formate lyase activating enzyme
MHPAAHKDAAARAARARELLRCCTICPRACAVDRMAGETGYCRLGAEAYCFQDVVHYGEEQELNPSHQVYFSGCNLVCGFCTVIEWVEAPLARAPVDLDALAARIRAARRAGARTLNLLGGEPSVSVHVILDLLARLPADIRVVWNSNMYYEPVVAELLDGLVDVYLADFKCGNNDCARSILRAGDYVEVVQRNLLAAVKSADVILRHLVMPGHLDCCMKPILTWIAEHVPQVKLSLRNNYLPPAHAVRAPAEFLDPADFRRATDEARRLSLRMIS